LTYSGWFTHISGHPSATGRAQDSESTPAKDRCYTAGPRNQRANLGCRSETWFKRLAERRKKSVKKSPSAHHRTTLSGYTFANIGMYRQSGKNLLSSNISSRCAHNTVSFGLLAAEIGPVVWAPQLISTAFASSQRYCTAVK